VLAVELVSEQLSSQVWTHIRYLMVWMEKCLEQRDTRNRIRMRLGWPVMSALSPALAAYPWDVSFCHQLLEGWLGC
jgi:hypothetical protein